MIKRLRKWLGSKILPDESMLLVSKSDKEIMERHAVLELSDEMLGRVCRRWFLTVGQVIEDEATQKKAPVSTIMSMRSVLAMAKLADEANADTLNMTVHGTIDGDKTNHTWHLEFKKLIDYDFGEEGVEIERDPNDPEKITSLTINTRLG